MHQTPSVHLTSPPAIVAALPHLLGFHPEESLVCLWLVADQLLVVQRADLPRESAIAEYADAYLAPADRLACDCVVVVCVTRSDRLAADVLPRIRRRVHVPVRAELVTDGSRVREAAHEDRWRSITAADRTWAQEVFGSPESASPSCYPFPDRSRIVAEVEFDPTSEPIGSTGQPAEWSWDSLESFVSGARWPADAAVIADVGHTVAGRDILMWWAARLAPPRRRELLCLIMAALRRMPDGHCAELACACAAIAWMCGDGVRANAALDRCRRAQPDHVMGQMLQAAMSAAVPPTAFADMLAQIDARALRLSVAPTPR